MIAEIVMIPDDTPNRRSPQSGVRSGRERKVWVGRATALCWRMAAARGGDDPPPHGNTASAQT